MSAPLKVVGGAASAQPPPSATASLNARIRELRAEARTLALEHATSLRDTLVRSHQIAEEIAAGGDAYPPGVRELAARLMVEVDAKARTLEAMLARF